MVEQKKRIALVAHDNKKRDLLEWARYNKVLLAMHEWMQQVPANCWNRNLAWRFTNYRADRWGVTSRSEQRFQSMSLTYWSFSGT